jgi:hypothetical protein
MLLALITIAVSYMAIACTTAKGKHFEAGGVIMMFLEQVAGCMLYGKVIEVNTALTLPICRFIALCGMGESYDFIADKYK